MRKSAIRLAVAGALLVGASGAAQANFKGIAVNEISNFTFTSTSGGALIFNPAAASLTSSSFAQWGDDVESNASPGGDPEMADCGPAGCDVLPAAWENSAGNLGGNPNPAGKFEANNDQLAGPQPYVGQAWARGDALIVNPNILTGGQAANVAEVVSGPGISTPFPVQANGVNSLNGTFQLEETAVLQFAFFASTFLEVWTPVGDTLSEVEADIEFNIAISDLAGGGGAAAIVFNWSPDGVDGGIFGGTDAGGDPFSLNTSLFSTAGIVNVSAYEAPDQFRATLTLGPGIYSLAITMREAAQGQQKIPVPATLALLGAGLFGIGAVRRRRALA